jgi:hypothetical protein
MSSGIVSADGQPVTPENPGIKVNAIIPAQVLVVEFEVEGAKPVKKLLVNDPAGDWVVVCHDIGRTELSKEEHDAIGRKVQELRQQSRILVPQSAPPVIHPPFKG